MDIIGHERLNTAMAAQLGCDRLLLEALCVHVSPQCIERILDQTGRREKRTRRLPATAVVWLVLLMELRSDLDLRSMWRQLRGVIGAGFDKLSGVNPPAKSAFPQARARLGARPLRQLLLLTGGGPASVQAGKPRTLEAPMHYKGMVMVAIDADSYKLPDTPANDKAFGRPATARDGKTLEAGYPQMHVNRLIEVGTHLCRDAIIKPYGTNDRVTAPRLLESVRPGELVLWDRGFYGFPLMQQVCSQGKFLLGPVPSHAVFKPLQCLSDGSSLVKIYASPNDRRDDRDGLTVRLIEYTLDDPARTGCGQRHRLITNLTDADPYPARELVALYHERWEIEIDNDEVTTHQVDRAVELRSKTPAGAVQEAYGVLVAHNAVRALMCESAKTVDIDPRRLSFINSVRIIRETVQTMRNACTEQLPVLYRAMLAEIASHRLPRRDGRLNPRVVKVVRPSNFPAKKPEHRNWPKPKRTFAESIVMLN